MGAATGDAAGGGWDARPIGENWIGGPVDAAVSVEVGPEPPPLSAELEAVVAEVWREARRERPALFNGRVFSVDRVGPERLVGHWTEYRRVLAQLRHPELFEALQLRPLAVNGLVEADDALLLGHRHDDAVYLPGRWQAAPSGNVEDRGDGDPLDLAAQLLAELEEELGIGQGPVTAIEPVVAVEHADTHVVDIGFLLRVALPFEEIHAAHRRTGNREYSALRAVGRDAVGALLDDGDSLLPSARVLLQVWMDRRNGTPLRPR